MNASISRLNSLWASGALVLSDRKDWLKPMMKIMPRPMVKAMERLFHQGASGQRNSNAKPLSEAWKSP